MKVSRYNAKNFLFGSLLIYTSIILIVYFFICILDVMSMVSNNSGIEINKVLIGLSNAIEYVLLSVILAICFLMLNEIMIGRFNIKKIFKYTLLAFTIASIVSFNLSEETDFLFSIAMVKFDLQSMLSICFYFVFNNRIEKM